jgi:hypothetical protein
MRLRRPPQRKRAIPARSRVTVRRAGANLVRSSLAAALRSGREALVDIEGQLEDLLAALRDPGRAIDAGAPERLRGAARQAGDALASLGAMGATGTSSSRR